MLKPRHHQIEASEAIHNELKIADRTTVTMACGTGKTKVQTMLVDLVAKEDGKIVVFAPTLLLINQLLSTWVEETNISFSNFVVVCSDRKTGILDDVDISEIEETKVAVSKNEKELDKFYKKSKGITVTLCTYSSTEILTKHSFDLGIFDESHKTVGRSDRLFSFALSNKNIEIKKRVFMTATKKNAKHKHLDFYSMDDEKVYGSTAYDLSFRKAIDLDLILDYKILITIITKQDLNKEILKKTDGLGVDFMHHANAIAVKKAISGHGLRKIITFHDTIRNSEIFSETLQHYVDFQTVAISSEQPKTTRNQNMQLFRNSAKSVASNARCLTEGIDVPGVDAVFFANDRSSVVDIVQAAGRTMRKSDNKTKGYIILPIYLETFSNEIFSEVVKQEQFGIVWSTLSALTEVDETLEVMNINLFNDLGRKHKIKNLSQFIEIDTSIEVDKNLLIDAISIEAASNYVESFEYRIGQLDNYVKKYGHGFVPLDYEDRNFAYWADWMRRSFKVKQLPLYKINKLKEFGFIFNLNDFRWEQGFIKYKKFINESKDKPFSEYPNDIKKWLSKQTYLKTNNKLSDERFKRLIDVGFIYKNQTDIWMHGYHKLLNELKNKSSLSDFTKKDDSYEWLRTQRKRWDKLSDDRKELLLNLGWEDYVNNLGRWKTLK